MDSQVFLGMIAHVQAVDTIRDEAIMLKYLPFMLC